VSTSPIAEVETGTNGRTTYWSRRSAGRRSKSVPPRAPIHRPRRRRRRSTVAAVLATCAYAGAAAAAYLLVAPALRDDAEATPRTTQTTPAATPAPAATDGNDLIALRTLAARAQRSVFVVEGAGGVQGSGFVAWSAGGKSYLLTSRTLVAGVLRDGGQTVFVRRGSSFWEADIAREDARSGLALLRVHDGIGRPLWARRGNDSLEAGGNAVIVPAGPDTPLEQAPVGGWSKGAFLLDAAANPLNVGAAVIGERGRVAGVVVSISPGGGHRVVPLGRACGPIRSCR
jgi:hypothetical protein